MAKGSKIGRSAKTGKFVLGRSAFASISAVEGIKLSRGMSGEFRKVEHASAEGRRAHLAETYGKKK
jgi:hypothetical protein